MPCDMSAIGAESSDLMWFDRSGNGVAVIKLQAELLNK